jgi:DNA-binding NarL/FixJ family response regulator
MGQTVLIVDDHRAFRESASALLAAQGYCVVGLACDGAEAIAQTRRLRPQIVLLDVGLPDLDGFATARRLAEIADPPRVVLTSSRDLAAYGPRSPSPAVRGFIAKRELSATSLAALVGGGGAAGYSAASPVAAAAAGGEGGAPIA